MMLVTRITITKELQLIAAIMNQAEANRITGTCTYLRCISAGSGIDHSGA